MRRNEKTLFAGTALFYTAVLAVCIVAIVLGREEDGVYQYTALCILFLDALSIGRNWRERTGYLFQKSLLCGLLPLCLAAAALLRILSPVRLPAWEIGLIMTGIFFTANSDLYPVIAEHRVHRIHVLSLIGSALLSGIPILGVSIWGTTATAFVVLFFISVLCQVVIAVFLKRTSTS